MTSRRTVRVDQAFFDDLDRQLGSRPDYRVADDSIVLLGIEIDLDWADEQLD